ncbi:hypothetical protein JCM1841_001147 [Sporobolomyces salmonicolor]
MSKRLTLAQQLAQISEPAPQDFDPEEAYTTYNAERSEEQRDLDAGRADYVDVGTSKLRKKGEAVLDTKYEGKKGSRKALYGAESEGSDEGEDMEDQDGFSGEGSEDDDDEEELGDFEDLEAEQDDDDSEDENEDEGDMPPPPPPKKSSATAKQQDERAMMKQLKQAASADVDKGRDVKKQLAFCDNLLESRIRLQKATASSNLLPQPALASSFFAHPALASDVSETFSELEKLSEELFGLREGLAAENEKVEVPQGFGERRKRKRGEEEGQDEWLEETLKDLATLESILNPFLRQTVTKWSDKVLAASGLSLSRGGSDKKFKAVNQNAMAQIDHSLSSTERERLLKRTRVRRGEGKVVGGGKGLVPLEGEEKAGEERGKEIDGECFDDTDFYQQLLRDVVESRMLDLDDATLNALRMASARGKKVKKVVDTRASKGRKIRYHVHEKIQNFMIPIEAAAWHDEQIDELFASLLGRTLGTTAATAEEEAVGRAEKEEGGKEVEVGSLRIFG